MERERNLFDRFGGVRPMAETLLEPPSTVQSWKSKGRIPATKQHMVLGKAAELGIDVHALDVIFPLRLRPDIYPPAEPPVPPPVDATAVEDGAPIVAFDRRAAVKQAACA